MLQNIAQLLNWLVGHDYLYFDNALEIKQTPHTTPFVAWGACASPAGDVYVMDADEEWHHVTDNDKSKLLIASLHQRVRYLVQKAQTKKEEMV